MAITSLNTTTRILGLASGMDTESIVKNLMQIERLKLNKQLRAQTTLQWRQEALKSVSTDMTSFRNTFLTTLGADAMRTSGTYLSYKVAMTGSKQDAVTIKATAEAAMRKITVNKITSLATAATAKSSSGVSGNGKTELSQGNQVKLGDLDFANALFTGTTTVKAPRSVQAEGTYGLEFMLMGEDLAGTGDSNTLVYLDENDGQYRLNDGTVVSLNQTQIDSLLPVNTVATTPRLDAQGRQLFRNGDGSDGHVYYYDTATLSYIDETGNSILDTSDVHMFAIEDIVYDDVQVPSNTIKFAINGVDFEFSRETTLAQMFSVVNNSTAGVTMTYSRLTDGFIISSKETGADSKLVIDNKHGNAFGVNSAFGIGEFGTATKDGSGKIVLDSNVTGQNAVVYIEGVRVERSTNVFSIDGINFTLNYTTGTEEVDADGKPITQVFNDADAVTATFTQDVEASVEKIKKFVEGYNTMINKLHGLVSETKDSKYFALTDDEKAEMTETQVAEWEKMAKSGLLRNDRDIQNVISQLRMAFYEAVEGTGLSAQDIGLRTTYNTRSGELTLDENDLRAALEKDPQAVISLFMQNSDDYGAQGLTYRLENIIKTYTGTTQYNTLSSMDRDMNKLVDKIADMEDRLATIEERYYKKYAAMETALSKLQSQTDWISSMLGTTAKK